MAGTLAIVTKPSMTSSSSLMSIRERWEVEFARFFCFPPLTSTTCHNLVPLPTKVRNKRSGGDWISASNAAMLQLIYDHSCSDVILTVCCNGKIQEEHYVSKLLFAWPQVACMSGYLSRDASRGSRSVFVSYRDSLGQIQKFAVKFVTVSGAENFAALVTEILKELRDVQPLTAEYGSEISSHSEFVSTNRPLKRSSGDLVVMAPGRTKVSPTLKKDYSPPQPSPGLVKDYSPQIPPRWTPEAAQYRQTQHMSPAAQNFHSNFGDFPPGFSSLVSSCQHLAEQAPTQPKEVDLSALIAKCMGDSSFEDILNQVESVMSEMGSDLKL